MRRLKWGYIDRKGTLVIEPRFDGAAPFCEGRALVRKKYLFGIHRMERWGFVNRKGSRVTGYRFGFAAGLALVRAGRKYGFIN